MLISAAFDRRGGDGGPKAAISRVEEQNPLPRLKETLLGGKRAAGGLGDNCLAQSRRVEVGIDE